MLRREELLRCGQGALGTRRWETSPLRRDPEGSEGAYHHAQQLKDGQPPKRIFGSSRGRSGGHPRRRGRNPNFARPHCRQHCAHQQQKQQATWSRCYRPTRARVLLSLRPVNMIGMRAPRNTNQFLMREKYQLMHLRSDSVGTESGGSDCEMDPLDMDSYLGVLENARGALMDCPGAEESPSPSPPALPLSPFPAGLSKQAPGLRFFGDCGEAGVLQEDSLQYFPSEDDVIESEFFMERDFHEFCSTVA